MRTPQFGFTLSSEEHDPRRLVEHARTAEDAGFDFLSISDHYHPWTSTQGHSPFVWAVLGAVAQATEHIDLATGVTCPIMRIHPAIIAQAAATTSLLSNGRFSLGVGTGEALNEHIVGRWWPPPRERLEMLEEAVDVIRRLWTGDTIEHRGRHFTVDRARLFDPPEGDVPIIVSAFGEDATDLAGRIGDGFWGTAPSSELVDRFAEAGGDGPRYAQLTVCWNADEIEARHIAHKGWPNAGLHGPASQELPLWSHFEEAVSSIGEDAVTATIPCGPDVGPFLQSVRQYLDAGYDHLYFHQIGDDQAGFFDFWERELRDGVSALVSARS